MKRTRLTIIAILVALVLAAGYARTASAPFSSKCAT
jgi:hypothetical protein